MSEFYGGNITPLWEKYGLSMSRNFFAEFYKKHETWKSDLDHYYDFLEKCHDRLCWHLEKYPEKQGKFFARVEGYMYFDIVAQVAKEELDEACEILNKYGARP